MQKKQSSKRAVGVCVTPVEWCTNENKETWQSLKSLGVQSGKDQKTRCGYTHTHTFPPLPWIHHDIRLMLFFRDFVFNFDPQIVSGRDADITNEQDRKGVHRPGVMQRWLNYIIISWRNPHI